MKRNNNKESFLFEVIYSGDNKDFKEFLNNKKVFSKSIRVYSTFEEYYFYNEKNSKHDFIYNKINNINRKNKINNIFYNKEKNNEISLKDISIRTIF